METQEKKRISKGALLLLLMILAILAATVLPAILGYQKQVRQLNLHVACRDIRVAAAEQAAELYREYGSVELLDSLAEDILEKAGHNGRITGTILCREPAEITYLSYRESNGDQIVYQNGGYYISPEQDEIVRSARAAMEQLDLPGKDDTHTFNEEELQAFRQEICTADGYPTLSEAEQKLLGDRQFRENWYWKPIAVGEKIFLAAEANRFDQPGAEAVLLYDNGDYYLPADGDAVSLPDLNPALPGSWVKTELF